jgi:putative sigma-54 modulation protein
MKVNLRIHDLPLADELAEYVDRRTRFTLSRYASRVAGLRVTVADDNGPRGGIDKVCRVTASFDGTPSVTVMATDSNVRCAVDRALARLSRSVRRTLERRLHHNGRWGSHDPIFGTASDRKRAS